MEATFGEDGHLAVQAKDGNHTGASRARRLRLIRQFDLLKQELGEELAALPGVQDALRRHNATSKLHVVRGELFVTSLTTTTTTALLATRGAGEAQRVATSTLFVGFVVENVAADKILMDGQE